MTTTGPTTTNEPETPARSAAPSKPRNPPRKLTMTDKIREARAINVNKVERLTKRADQLREQLAATVRELNDARAEVERADAVLPQEPPPGMGGDPNGLARSEQLEAERFTNGAAVG